VPLVRPEQTEQREVEAERDAQCVCVLAHHSLSLPYLPPPSHGEHKEPQKHAQLRQERECRSDVEQNIDRTDLPVDATITVALGVFVVFVLGCCLLGFSLPTIVVSLVLRATRERIESDSRGNRERIESESRANGERIESESRANRERIESESRANRERIDT
jgi:hypothetical protein